MKSFFLIVIVFSKTFFYILWSFLQPSRLQELVQKWAQSAMRSFGYKVQIHGEPPPLENCAMILVGNHMSYLDIVLLMSVTRGIVFIAKNEVRNWPIIGYGAARAKTIFVERDNKENRAQVRLQIAQQLKQYQSKVVVFPSGTTTLDEDRPWKRGIFEVAAEAGLPVKAFHLDYSPRRESAYIDDDSLIGQMKLQSDLKNKQAVLTWLDEYNVDDVAVNAENIRQKVVAQFK